MLQLPRAISVSFMAILCKPTEYDITEYAKGDTEYFLEILPIKVSFHLHQTVRQIQIYIFISSHRQTFINFQFEMSYEMSFR